MILSPVAFWLLPLALAALLWIRFFRTRKQELLTGSLLVWKRLAAQQPLKPPRRFELDRSLFLQALALIALVSAVAHPRIEALPTGGRTVVIAVDNGPLSRFRDAQEGKPLWDAVKNDAQSALQTFSTNDRIILIRSAPAPKILFPEGLAPDQAIIQMHQVLPALSGPEPAELLEFAQNTARTLNQTSVAVFSAASAPSPDTDGSAWFCTGGKADDNVGFVAFGAVPAVKNGTVGAQVLARIHNAGARSWSGTVVAEQSAPLFKNTLDIPPGEDREVLLDGVRAGQSLTLRIETTDSLAEDNQLIARARTVAPLSVRFHSAIPALENLFDKALRAVRYPAESTEPVDLEIFRGAPPQQWPGKAKAILLIEPSSGFRFFFDVGDATLTSPRVVRDESSPLTDKFDGSGDAGLFPVRQAVEFMRTGPFTSLLKDAKSQRTLSARFVDEQDRPGYVFAFTPGEGAAPETLLPPELATLLIRIAREAAGTGELFTVETATAKEAQNNEPLVVGERSFAVLDPRVTASRPGTKTSARFDAAHLKFANQNAALDLRPWLVMIATVLIGLDFVTSRRASSALLRAGA